MSQVGDGDEEISTEEWLKLTEEEKHLKISQAINSSPLAGNLLEGFMAGSLLEGENELDTIPWDRATIRMEYRSTRQNLLPYYYAYWKDKGVLRKRYIGKSIGEYKQKLDRLKLNKELGINWTTIQWDKYEILKIAATCGSQIAAKYLKRFDIFGARTSSSSSAPEDIPVKMASIDWAFRVVRNEIRRDPQLSSKVNMEIRKAEAKTRRDQNPSA